MGLPWRAISIGSFAAAFALTWSRPEFSRLFLFGTFAGLWSLQFFLWAVYTVLIWPNFLTPLRGLPEPAGGHWLHGQWFKIRAEPTGYPQIRWINEIPHDGVIRYRGFLNQDRVLVANPKALAEVMVTKNYEFEKPPTVRSGISRILGVGVLLAEGDEHKLQRRKLMPAFAFRHVKDLYPTFWAKAVEGVHVMVDRISQDAAKETSTSTSTSISTDSEKADHAAAEKDGAVLEIGSWASRTTLDIIGVAGLGCDFGAIQDPENELNKTYRTLFSPSRQARILGLLGLLLPAWVVNNLPVRRNEDVMVAVGKIRSVCRDLINTKKEKMARKELVDTDILSVALESGHFSDEGLVDQLMTFLAAGHETTASAMTWAIYMLCRYPEIQKRLRQEVRERLPPASALGGSVGVSSMDIDHMPYLTAVCNEVLRYYSPVPMTMRQAAVDTTIQGHFIPRGTTVILATTATNKSVAMWGPDAGRFDPERWLPKHEGDKLAASGGAESNYAFMTFLHGPRSCIGSGFARAEFACLLAAWIRTFEFELRDPEDADEDKLEIRGGITARPSKGLWVRAKVVEGW